MSTPRRIKLDQHILRRVLDYLVERRVSEGDHIAGVGFLGLGLEACFLCYEVAEGVQIAALAVVFGVFCFAVEPFQGGESCVCVST